MLNIASENSIDAMKKLNNVNKDARIDNKVRNEAVRDIAESSNANNQIFENVFENDATDDNLSNSKIRNIHTRVKSDIRRFNRLTEIENSLSSVERSTNTTAFATIDKISIEKE